MKHRINQKAFTLLELLVAIAIVAILAGIAIPNYFKYTKRAKFSSVLLAVDAAKIKAIQLCSKKVNNIENCKGIDLGITGPDIASAAVEDGGLLKIVTTDKFNGVDLKLTPAKKGSRITWTMTGTACDAGYVDCENDAAGNTDTGNTNTGSGADNTDTGSTGAGNTGSTDAQAQLSGVVSTLADETDKLVNLNNDYDTTVAELQSDTDTQLNEILEENYGDLVNETVDNLEAKKASLEGEIPTLEQGMNEALNETNDLSVELYGHDYMGNLKAPSSGSDPLQVQLEESWRARSDVANDLEAVVNAYEKFVKSKETYDNAKTGAKEAATADLLAEINNAYAVMGREPITDINSNTLNEANASLKSNFQSIEAAYNKANEKYKNTKSDFDDKQAKLQVAKGEHEVAENNLKDKREEIKDISELIEFKNPTSSNSPFNMLANLRSNVTKATGDTKAEVKNKINNVFNELVNDNDGSDDGADKIVNVQQVLQGVKLSEVQSKVMQQLDAVTKNLEKLQGTSTVSGNIKNTDELMHATEQETLKQMYQDRLAEMQTAETQLSAEKEKLISVENTIKALGSPDANMENTLGAFITESDGRFSLKEDFPEMLQPILDRFVQFKNNTIEPSEKTQEIIGKLEGLKNTLLDATDVVANINDQRKATVTDINDAKSKGEVLVGSDTALGSGDWDTAKSDAEAAIIKATATAP